MLLGHFAHSSILADQFPDFYRYAGKKRRASGELAHWRWKSFVEGQIKNGAYWDARRFPTCLASAAVLGNISWLRHQVGPSGRFIRGAAGMPIPRAPTGRFPMVLAANPIKDGVYGFCGLYFLHDLPLSQVWARWGPQ